MDDETDSDNSAAVSEGVAGYAAMHYQFEIELMTSEILGIASSENRTGFDREVKRRHVRNYLLDYYKKHGALPMGRHHLGMTRPLNLEIGMIDLGAIRHKIRADSERSNITGRESRSLTEVAADYSPHSEGESGMRQQTIVRDPDRTILDLQRERGRREKKPGRRR